MSGRHTGRTGKGLRFTALPATLRLIFKLAPRQLNDEIALAKVEIKRKGIQLGVAAAFFGVALVFLGLLVIALVVAAIMGLATVMPAWLAALLVAAFFLVVAGIGALVGLAKFKKAMPLMPEETIRGIKHDLGVAKEGSAFNAAVLDPKSPEAKAAKAAKEEAAAKAKAEKEAKAAAQEKELPPASEAELHRRLSMRRKHLVDVRDDLGEELDVKTQLGVVKAAASQQAKAGQRLLHNGRERLDGTMHSLAGGKELDKRWKPLLALATSGAVLVILLRKFFKGQ
ncbi:phage holin family protein [Pseudarthrobacter sp. J75]|uniref:phage holin family protein n=1 Tax=unclassified Pseudarthrobacter TaxID=2647000 RepID=UPI002E81E267|nr:MULTISPECIES: phage holin family protein [unclassified Pseudarthrobacter]MEE2521754.1 phage holin family protein [Pseudarthrobacter sp. J47]MEE2527831.1 phage holin family protein [Pseudarthrobacter sp. J75]